MVESLRETILILVSSPIYLIIIGLEVFLSNYKHEDHHHRSSGSRPKTYTWSDTLTNVYLMLLNGGIDLLFRGVYLLILTVCYRHHWISITNVLRKLY